MFDVTTCILLLSLSPAAATSSSTSHPFVDTHLHLHPKGLDAAMGQGSKQTARNTRESTRTRGSSSPQDMAENLEKAADQLAAMLAAKGIGTGLVMVVPSFRLSGEEDYSLIRDAVGRHPGRLRLMAGGATLNPIIQDSPMLGTSDENKSTLRQRAERILDEGAIGFGEMISYHLCMNEKHNYQFAPADHPLFLELSDLAARRDVALDLHMEAVESPGPMPERLRHVCSKNPDQVEVTVPALERLLAHNRQTRIVWQHIGWDNTGGMSVPLLRRLLAGHTNLYLALRVARLPPNAKTPPNRLVDGKGHILPEWLELLEQYPDRFMIGSDEFIGPTGGAESLAVSFDETWDLLTQLPADLAEKIGGANARRVYGLN